jgi:hypothetical protein
MSAASLGSYHIRGMTDSGGSPNAEIDTVAVEHWNDGSLKVTLVNGRVISIRDAYTKRMLEDILGVDFSNLS